MMDDSGFIYVVGVIGVDVDVGLIILLDFHNPQPSFPSAFVSWLFSLFLVVCFGGDLVFKIVSFGGDLIFKIISFGGDLIFKILSFDGDLLYKIFRFGFDHWFVFMESASSAYLWLFRSTP